MKWMDVCTYIYIPARTCVSVVMLFVRARAHAHAHAPTHSCVMRFSPPDIDIDAKKKLVQPIDEPNLHKKFMV